ncbi:MAG: hypothetical protein WDO14_12575 [Bacteroidota bacterium]
MNVIFTIVARNYLPLAMTLADRVKVHHPGMDFYIFLADEILGSFDPAEINVPVIEVKNMGIDNLQDMAFKYNVTEFCTAVKPFCFDYLFRKGYTKAIYFDPDIYVLNSLDGIFNDLDNNFIVLTPHYITPEVNYTGVVPEGLILFVGIYNCGFVALKNDTNGNIVVSWWMNRLRDKAYADKLEGFHTDQKWMDFIPGYFGTGVAISRNLGYNMSVWNLHERRIEIDGDKITIHHKQGLYPSVPLTFFHFAGFDANNLSLVHKNYPMVSISNYPGLEKLYARYKEDLVRHQFDRFIKLPYHYNFYSNKMPVVQFQRRIYKQLVREGWKFNDPFTVGADSFYELMKSNRMLVKPTNSRNIDRMNERSLSDFGSKIRIINVGARMVKFIVGFQNYALLSKFFLRYFRPENQTFLVKQVKKYRFVNENSGDEA